MQWLKQRLPTREALQGSRWMRWLPGSMHHPRLWHWSRRGVALGIAVGVFFGIIIPTAQIPFSAVAAAIVRANLPAAAASTLVSNPLTTPPIYYGAYRVGKWLLDEDGEAAIPGDAAAGSIGSTLQAEISRIGPPLFLGLSCIAVAASIISYVVTSLIWVFAVSVKRRRGRQNQTGA